MLKSLIILCLCLSTVTSSGQSDMHTAEYNFGFEKITPHEMLPDLWFNWGRGYDLTIDTIEKHTGNVSVRIQPAGEVTPYDVGSIGASIPADFKGSVMELRAYMKFVDITQGPVYLGIIVTDISGSTLARAHNYEENIQGTSDWAMYSIKMPLPENAAAIYIAAALSGRGKLWVDDFQLLIDGREVDR